MTYYVEAKRFGRDHNGELWVVDKRVHVGLEYDEARKLMQKYSPKVSGYWSECKMSLEEDNIEQMIREWEDGKGEGQVE